MKKILLCALAFGAVQAADAQIADGSVAPDFTATDLNGNSHTLSDYLTAGKTVILDISATWCGPCWNYHNSHALADIYHAYGPDGSDEVMVFFIEGDGATTLANLNGIGSNTQGDWVTGTPYPIIDSDVIADDYQIGFFPTIYRICPDGFVYEIGQMTASAMKSNINSQCGALTGVTNHASVHGSEMALCSTSAAPTVTFKNYGTNSITSATVVLKENGVTVATQPFAGTVAQFATGSVTFSSVTINDAMTYTVELTAVNTVAPFDNALTTDGMDIVSAEVSGYAIQVKFFTDNYPAESTWEIRNSSTNALVASGGPYVGAGGTAAGGPDALTTKTHDVTLPAGNNCYKVNIFDDYGDGLLYGTNPAGQYGMEIISEDITVLNLDLGNFGSELERDAALKTDATSGIEEEKALPFSVYPNPATEVLNIVLEAAGGDYLVQIIDLQGRVIVSEGHTLTAGSQTVVLPVSEIASGSYIVAVTTNGVTKRDNVVIK